MAIVIVGSAVQLATKDKRMLHMGCLRLELDNSSYSYVYLSADEARLLASEIEALADRLDRPKAADE